MGQWKIKEDYHKILDTNENASTTSKILQSIIKAILKGKFIVIQIYLKKKEKFQVKQPNLPHKWIIKRKTMSKVSLRKEIIKNRGNKIETKEKTTENIKEIKILKW